MDIDKLECKYIVFKDEDKPPLVLLHGYSFKSTVWRDIGLLNRLEDEGIPYLAIDMPYGKISECNYKTRKVEINIGIVNKYLRREFHKDLPYILGASLGGYIALEYGIANEVRGLILVAPVWSNKPEIIGHYSKSETPILLIYGGKDKIVPLREMKRFQRETRNTQLLIYEDASHPAYLDYPSKFANDVVLFIKRSG